MLSFDDYRACDALELAERVRKRKVSPQELLDAALARSAEVNPRINAIVLDHADLARQAIADGLPDGPLRGVPYLLKDLGAAMKGTVCTGSLSLTRDVVADKDST
jgi:Asp-tRNA(Asn)/Glu-tRNA(Gln) amidotransferase A subunit family amidase